MPDTNAVDETIANAGKVMAPRKRASAMTNWYLTEKYSWSGPKGVGPHDLWRAQVWWEPCGGGEGFFADAYHVTTIRDGSEWSVVVEYVIEGSHPAVARGPFGTQDEALEWALAWVEPAEEPPVTTVYQRLLESDDDVPSATASVRS